MKKLTKKALLQHLTKSDKEDIVKEILTLYTKFENVKEYYKAELSGDTNPVLDSYKKKSAKLIQQKILLNAEPIEMLTNC